VVASLFYLASQIRRNSTALEAATNQSISDATQQRLLVPAQNAELAAALDKARIDAGSLSSVQRVQLTFLTRATFRGAQNAFFQHRQELMSKEAWRDYDAILRLNLERTDVREWWPVERYTYDDAFAIYVDRLLSESQQN
jgi:hypothetical protein